MYKISQNLRKTIHHDFLLGKTISDLQLTTHLSYAELQVQLDHFYAQQLIEQLSINKQNTIQTKLIALIRWYQRTISANTPPNCRFYPTCSQYTIEAIHMHGSLKGSLLGIWRILRCNPFNKHFGFDPVPDKTCKHHNHT